jgi:protein-S-isoprenylcysteine O-methyltransferase Ste14
MKTSEIPDGKPFARASISRRMALILAPIAWLVAIPLGHGVVPWAISLLTPHYGWTANRPGIWNLPGLILVVAGAAGLIWIFVLGIAKAAELPERIELDWSPKLLLMRGPYAFTRNPMYVAELAIWFGWAIFFGSAAVLSAFVMLCVVMNLIIRREERDLEIQFGETYCQYKGLAPRWLGKSRH